MLLNEYINAQRGNATALADKIGVSLSYLSQLAAIDPEKRAALSPIRAVQIEEATDRLVTRQEMRPDDWHLIWPELRAATEKEAA